MKLLFLETQPIRPKVDVETHNSRNISKFYYVIQNAYLKTESN